jgi:hypothetical protein
LGPSSLLERMHGFDGISSSIAASRKSVWITP